MRHPHFGIPGTLAAIVILATSGVAGAQPYDHLKCFNIKDLQPKQKYTADLTPEQTQFLAQTGCELKVPAKQFCVDVDKSNVVPAPPNAIGGQNTRDFLCYQLKCPKLAEFEVAVEDQFGTRNIKVKKSQRLCVPARKVGFPDPATPTPCVPPTPGPTSTPGCMPQLETCNGVDDDCNMVIDDIPNAGMPCDGVDGDFCQEGTIFCQGVVLACSDTTGTTSETCNNVDDDCDGGTDNGLGSTSCGTGQCQNTVQNCVAGMMQSCTPNSPSPEVCDGVDNDCDGQTNEGVTCPVPNGSQQCIMAICQGSLTCDPGYADCDSQAVNGCEVNTQTDPQHCGGCNLFCPGVCSAGSCTP